MDTAGRAGAPYLAGIATGANHADSHVGMVWLRTWAILAIFCGVMPLAIPQERPEIPLAPRVDRIVTLQFVPPQLDTAVRQPAFLK